jgi:gamma-glutamyltranspeptidase/glutathione hydrolase
MPASDGADTRDIVTVASPCCNAPMTPLATAGPISVAAHFAAAWRRLRIVRRRIDRYRCVVFAALFIGIAVSAGAQPAPEVSSGWIDHAPVRAQHWMIAAANPLAVDAGYAMLARGGSAVDAVIAAQLVLGLVEPQSSGIGGGAFMLVHDAAHRTLAAYDGRETAPAAAQPDRFIGRDGKPLPFHDAVVGGRSVGVPGVPRLLQLAHRRHGKLPWASLFAPAIALAENGFAVSPRLHALIASERYFLQPRIRAYFLDAAGAPLPVGHRLRNPAYAATLRTLARDGADAFYAGAIAQDVVDTADGYVRNPGDLTLADLAGYRALRRTPVCGAYRRYRVCGMPPPSSGGIALLQTLSMLERFDLRAMGPDSLWSVHFISEAERLAYADRDRYVADPAFVDVPPGLLDPVYLAARGALIRSDTVFGHADAGDPPRDADARRTNEFGEGEAAEFPSTSQIVVVDGRGNAVSMTTTIEDQFGSRLMTNGGFLLNNELTDFSFVARDKQGRLVANRVEAHKRPRSTMAPTIVYDRAGRVAMLAGSPGGSAIANYVAKTLIGVIDWQLDPQAAVALGNFGSRNGPTELEAGTPVAGLAAKLRAMGYDVRVGHQTSGLQAIVRTRDGWIGGTDPRREGVVRGR